MIFLVAPDVLPFTVFGLGTPDVEVVLDECLCSAAVRQLLEQGHDRRGVLGVVEEHRVLNRAVGKAGESVHEKVPASSAGGVASLVSHHKSAADEVVGDVAEVAAALGELGLKGLGPDALLTADGDFVEHKVEEVGRRGGALGEEEGAKAMLAERRVRDEQEGGVRVQCQRVLERKHFLRGNGATECGWPARGSSAAVLPERCCRILALWQEVHRERARGYMSQEKRPYLLLILPTQRRADCVQALQQPRRCDAAPAFQPNFQQHIAYRIVERLLRLDLLWHHPSIPHFLRPPLHLPFA